MHSDVVNDVSYAGLVIRGNILGLERRRRWCAEEKLEIVLSVGVDGATVTQVAQRHELKKKGLLSALPDALFLPVDLDRPLELAMPPAVICADAPRSAQIELQLVNGRCLRFDPALDAVTLTQVIRAVEAA